MEIKFDFLHDNFDDTYKVFTKADNGQNLLIGKFMFADERDFRWEHEFMVWLCSHVRQVEKNNG